MEHEEEVFVGGDVVSGDEGEAAAVEIPSGVNWGCDVVLGGVRRCGIERIGGVDVFEMGL